MPDQRQVNYIVVLILMRRTPPKRRAELAVRAVASGWAPVPRCVVSESQSSVATCRKSNSTPYEELYLFIYKNSNTPAHIHGARYIIYVHKKA